MNEVSVHWHSEVLQVCWFPHRGATNRQEERTDLRHISPWDSNSHSPFFALWFLVSDDPVMSREIHSHHLDWINKGSKEYRIGMIFLLCYNEYYVIWWNPSTGVINSWGEIKNYDLLVTVAANNSQLKLWCTRGNSSLSKPLQILDSETIEIVCDIGTLGANHAGFPVHQWLLSSHKQHS